MPIITLLERVILFMECRSPLFRKNTWISPWTLTCGAIYLVRVYTTNSIVLSRARSRWRASAPRTRISSLLTFFYFAVVRYVLRWCWHCSFSLYKSTYSILVPVYPEPPPLVRFATSLDGTQKKIVPRVSESFR